MCSIFWGWSIIPVGIFTLKPWLCIKLFYFFKRWIFIFLNQFFLLKNILVKYLYVSFCNKREQYRNEKNTLSRKEKIECNKNKKTVRTKVKIPYRYRISSVKLWSQIDFIYKMVEKLNKTAPKSVTRVVFTIFYELLLSYETQKKLVSENCFL